jgi:hypothetical protein
VVATPQLKDDMTLRRCLMRGTRLVATLAPYTASQYCPAGGQRLFFARADALRQAAAPGSETAPSVGAANAGAACISGGGAPSLLDGLLTSNQFTQGGLTLMVVGACLAAARSALLHG